MNKLSRFTLENWLAITGIVFGVASTAITVYVSRKRTIVLSDAQLVALELLLKDPSIAAPVETSPKKSRSEQFDEMRKPGGRP